MLVSSVDSLHLSLPPCRNCELRDVKDVGYVINYDFPNNCEDYIRRIGRTGVRPSFIEYRCLADLHYR
ncbi:hypothetical protein FIBSPDRAFT_267647 [Athelia psychrophila]|uniref:Helicase C-terminal domain-containing protein n=1 Tax=Athelia psychrophila TaxID=1759441 RepID=A0A166RH10_9AGAM|nr:hypothetical protein FIBSPDRAFT_267647 [Fibularhizoctonia sp. CBS 109695]